MRIEERIYNVNVRRLALLVLPTWLRRPLAGALIYAGVCPLGRLLGELRSYRRETGYRLSHNGQVCRLRGVLNDEFDPERRRIVIEDGGPEGGGESPTVWLRERGGGACCPGVVMARCGCTARVSAGRGAMISG